MSHFYVIGTPIGNLEDITLRALSVLKSVDLILCEDTRMTKRLLDRHEISKRTMSYHAHSEFSRTAEIVQMLKEGKNIALVSDAGTPGISDPGSELVRIIRGELSEAIMSGGLKIEAIPGPSALTAALSIAGIACADFLFLGFLPHKKGRETLFKEIFASERTVIFYESPHRIMKTLESLAIGEAKVTNEKTSKKDRLQDEDQNEQESSKTNYLKITVCRELTKIFEEVVSGNASEVKEYFEAHADKVRGEFVVIVSRGL